ncbi:MAG: GspE/PulE family protein [Planctomycetota bacterium]
MLSRAENLVLQVSGATGLDATVLNGIFEEAGRSEREFLAKLVDKELLGEERCYEVWADALGMPYHSLSERLLAPAILHRLPLQLARRYGAVAVDEGKDWIEVVFFHPFDVEGQEAIERYTHKTVRPAVSSPAAIQRALARQEKGRTGIEALLAGLGDQELEHQALADEDRLQALTGNDSVVQLVDYLLEEALRAKASDIHIEVAADRLRCRLRIDGELEAVHRFPLALQAPIVSRIKVLSGLDISERRKPQDGRFLIDTESGQVEFRVSVMPSVNGEKVVLRILDKASMRIDLESIGFAEDVLTLFRKGIHASNGLVLLTGPTGSGKSTTLYAALSEINDERFNIVTIEDPVEYELVGTTQIQVDARAGRTFATALRSILRQDPDVVMVGEIRDAETARIAIQAALTGHLVFSTVHTNDAIGTVHRLIDMGVEPWLLGPALRCATAHRLLRRNCVHCAAPHEPDPAVLAALRWPDDLPRTGIRRGTGCDDCRGKGRLGRIAIHEVIYFNRELQAAVSQREPEAALLRVARDGGTRSLLFDGLVKVARGLVAPEDLLGIVQVD